MSTNNLYSAISRGKFASIIKTKEARIFEKELTSLLLNEYTELKDEFYQKFNTNNEIRVTCTFSTPKMYTKQNKVSSHSGDLDNYLKQYLDGIFKAIGIDDKFVTEIVAFKRVGKDFKAEFLIEEITGSK